METLQNSTFQLLANKMYIVLPEKKDSQQSISYDLLLEVSPLFLTSWTCFQVSLPISKWTWIARKKKPLDMTEVSLIETYKRFEMKETAEMTSKLRAP